METKSQKFKIRLGLFVAIGLGLFILAVFVIGKQKNVFDPVYTLHAKFYNVSGLQVGNNVRFSGINVGTVDNIRIINDSTVEVAMLIKKSVMLFIKTDSKVAIGSEGLIGDKLLIITQGSTEAKTAKPESSLTSDEPVEMDDIIASLQITAENAEIITEELADIMIQINSGRGTLGRLIQDSSIAENFDKIIVNLKSSSKGLDENMEAAKHNFLLRGYFNKKSKAAERKKERAAEKLRDSKSK